MDNNISRGYIAYRNIEVFGRTDSFPEYAIKGSNLVFIPTHFSILNRMRFIYNLPSKTKTA